MNETESSRRQKARLVVEGLHHIVAAQASVVGIVGATLAWFQDGRSTNILLLFLILFVIFNSIILLFTYLKYEKMGTRFDAMTGDLAEGYSHLRDRHNRVLADLWLLAQVIRLIPTGMKSFFRA